LCKHSFSKEAILSLIKQSGNVVPCPIPGCEKQIMEHNLKENRRLERKVAQEYKKKKKSNKMDDVEVKKRKYKKYNINNNLLIVISFFFLIVY
jgi:hypothetical protein